MAKKALTKKRLPIAALLLSTFALGPGQVYDTHLRMGIITTLLSGFEISTFLV
jgi:hypothetical protein